MAEIPQWMLDEGAPEIARAQRERERVATARRIASEREHNLNQDFSLELDKYGPIAQSKANILIHDFLKLANGRTEYFPCGKGWFITAGTRYDPGDWEMPAKTDYWPGIVLDHKGLLRRLSSSRRYQEAVLGQENLVWDASAVKHVRHKMDRISTFGDDSIILPSFVFGIKFPHCNICAPGNPRLRIGDAEGHKTHDYLLSSVLTRIAIEKSWI